MQQFLYKTPRLRVHIILEFSFMSHSSSKLRQGNVRFTETLIPKQEWHSGSMLRQGNVRFTETLVPKQEWHSGSMLRQGNGQVY